MERWMKKGSRTFHKWNRNESRQATKYARKNIVDCVLHRNSNVVRSSDCILDSISFSLSLSWRLYTPWTIDGLRDSREQLADRTMFDFEAVVIGTYIRVCRYTVFRMWHMSTTYKWHFVKCMRTIAQSFLNSSENCVNVQWNIDRLIC